MIENFGITRKMQLLSSLKDRRAERKEILFYITVGLGKTLILMNYLVYLVQVELIPKYCVYSLPVFASESVATNLKTYGKPVNILDMRKTSKTKVLVPNSINFIDHDRMILN